MKATDILEGTARSRNTNDRWDGTDVDVYAHSKELKLRVRNFMNSEFNIPIDWKEEITRALFSTQTDHLDDEQAEAFHEAMELIWGEAVVNAADQHIEEKVMEVLDVAERLIKSMMFEYHEEYRSLIEKYARYLIENPDKADVILDNIKAIKS